MRLSLLCVGIPVLVLAGCLLGARAAGPHPSPQTLRFDGRAAFEDLEALVSKFGRRPTGSEKDRAAVAWIRDRFRADGIEAETSAGKVGFDDVVNVVARIPGSTDRSIVVLGHHDTVPISPGAEDNGSAVAALFGLARALRGRSLRHTVLLCSTDAEEVGGAGAEHLVRTLGPEGIARTDACIGLEMLAWPDGRPVLHALPRNYALSLDTYVPAGLPAVVCAASPEPLALGDPYVGPLVQTFTPYVRVPSGSDDVFFLRAGVPAVLLTRSSLLRFYPHYHTENDTPDKLSPTALESSGRILEAAVLAVDEGGDLRRGPAQYLLVAGAVLDRTLQAVCAGALALCLALFAARRRGPPRRVAVGAVTIAVALGGALVRYAPHVLMAVWPLGVLYPLLSSIRSARWRVAIFWTAMIPAGALGLLYVAARRAFGVQLPSGQVAWFLGSVVLAAIGFCLGRAGPGGTIVPPPPPPTPARSATSPP